MLPGVRDWRHPSAWKPVIYGLSALVFIWMLGSSLVIWTKEQQITSALALATEGAEEVIQARDRVDDIGSKLTIINQLNTRQQLPLVLLRDLAVALPEDVWLQTLTLNQDLLELRGQGKNAATLAGQLEKIARVKRVSYVGDIRPDPQSGQEFFALRLQIDNGKND